MPTNRGTRHRPRYSGRVSYKGRKKWVGSYATVGEYKRAAEKRLAELKEEIDGTAKPKVPTVAEFAGARFRDDGRIEMLWPEGQRPYKDTGRKASTVKRMREGLRPFLREFADRRLDSFSRDEALSWADGHGSHTRQSVRALFNHALDRDLIDRNPFARLGASKRRRRIERPDFEIITPQQYRRLRECARASRLDDYGLIIEGAILAVGETGMRPGEVFALHHSDVDFEANLIRVRWQLDSTKRTRVWPKDDEPRWVLMSPTLREHLARMPVLSEIVFPAPRGGYMTTYNWSKHWHSVRASAGMPGLEFYELKHRAIQWMVDPVEDGGLGLDPQTVALMVGHNDGGYLISTVYTKLSERRARERAQQALDAFQERQAAEGRQLHVVGA